MRCEYPIETHVGLVARNIQLPAEIIAKLVGDGMVDPDFNEPVRLTAQAAVFTKDPDLITTGDIDTDNLVWDWETIDIPNFRPCHSEIEIDYVK